MANYTATSPESVHFIFDLDDDEGNRIFRIENAARALLEIDEAGNLLLHGNLRRAGAPGPTFDNTTASGDIVSFRSAGVEKAKVNSLGVGAFSAGARLPVVTVSPDGTRAGNLGDLVVYNNAGTYHVYACWGPGAMRWQRATQV